MNVQVLSKHQIWAILCTILLIVLAAAGCSQGESAANPAPSAVEVVEVQQKDVPIYGEWIGTLDGLVNADIKAQVSGYLLKQAYTEGSLVRKGQLLFEIDPRPFQASLDQARGQLAQATGGLAQAKAQLVQSEAQLAAAEANQHKAQLDEDRYIPLARQQAITQQDRRRREGAGAGGKGWSGDGQSPDSGSQCGRGCGHGGRCNRPAQPRFYAPHFAD